MKIHTWIQMGCEQREVTFEVSEAEIARVGEDGLATLIDEMAARWRHHQYRCGWRCEFATDDFLEMFDDEVSSSFTLASALKASRIGDPNALFESSTLLERGEILPLQG